MWNSWKSGWPIGVFWAYCLVTLSGCANMSSGIDPSGEHVFAPPPNAQGVPADQRYFDEPLGRLPWDDVLVQLQPVDQVAAVGSEVVLVAGVGAADGYLRTNRRLEWSISQGSVGSFVAVEKNGIVDLLLFDFNWPRKVSSTFAVGSTSRDYVRLNRGTCTPDKDVYVLRCQGWITVTSPVEGDTHVTVLAPEVYSWNARTKSATIHWVDAQWRFPPPAINPAGTKHVFTTTVTRQSCPTPRAGWLVRYEILDGPPAGFMPDGVAAIEVPTNAAGQACAEIFQKQPGHGTNRVGIQVIRPGDVPGANGQRLVIASGTTMKTWTAADLAVRVIGPQIAAVGAPLSYRVEVENPGELVAQEVVVTETIPDGLSYVSSNPAAETMGRQLQWRLGNLGSRQIRPIEVNFRAEREGSVTNCCAATASGDLKADSCVTTTICAQAASPPSVATPGASPLEIKITPAAAQAAVGDKVTFEILVTNRGMTPLSGLTIKDRFDPGLDPGVPEAAQTHSLKRSLGNIAAGGASPPIKLTFRVTQSGRLCHVVEVGGAGLATISQQACVTVASSAPPTTDAGPIPPITGPGAAEQAPPPTTQPPVTQPPTAQPAAKPALAVHVTGPTQTLAVGEMASFSIEVTNKGTESLRNIKVSNSLDPMLIPRGDNDMQATPGCQWEGYDLVWTIDALAAGQTNQFSIVTKCQGATAKACDRVKVTSTDGVQTTAEACFEIRASGSATTEPKATPPETTPPTEKSPTANQAAGKLLVNIPGLHNPVAVDKSVTYRIEVTNNSTQTYRQVTVTATLPEGFVPEKMGTGGPNNTSFRTEASTGKVYFTPVFEVRPNSSLVYEVRGLARRPGQGRFSAELTSPDLPQPITQSVSAEAVQ